MTQPQVVYVRKERSNGLAVASLVLGIIGVLPFLWWFLGQTIGPFATVSYICGVVGFILGCVAIGVGRSRALAIVATLLCAVPVGVLVVFLLSFAS